MLVIVSMPIKDTVTNNTDIVGVYDADKEKDKYIQHRRVILLGLYEDCIKFHMQRPNGRIRVANCGRLLDNIDLEENK